MKTGKDPFTGEVFVKTRRNQIYASRENQVKFNNQKAFEKRQMQSEINSHLERNYKILKSALLNESEILVDLDYMKISNFNFGCVTHIACIQSVQWYCIYNLGYRKIPNGHYQIKKIENGTDV